MPIPSRKPSRGSFKPGTKPKPMLGDFASEAQITNTTQARRDVNRFNQAHLRITQPYDRAAELRAGQAFPQMQRAQVAAEREGIDGPYSRGMNSVAMGKNRRLRDVGP